VGLAVLALAGGVATAAVFGAVPRNRIRFKDIACRLRRPGLAVLAQPLVPANHGGLVHGQGMIAAILIRSVC